MISKFFISSWNGAPDRASTFQYKIVSQLWFGKHGVCLEMIDSRLVKNFKGKNQTREKTYESDLLCGPVNVFGERYIWDIIYIYREIYIQYDRMKWHDR